MYYTGLTRAEKKEIRRLSILANNRIRRAMAEYEKAGMDTIPREIAGKTALQSKDGWYTDKTPISTSVVFKSKKEYTDKLKELRRFDKMISDKARPTLLDYTEVQRQKMALAIDTSDLGSLATYDSIMAKLDKLSATDLSRFWEAFSGKAAHMGMQYSSDQVMEATYLELFPEDMYSTLPA